MEESEADGVLWESEARYRALFESEFFCVYLHDLEGRYLEANDTALKLLGYTRDEIKSLSFPMLIHPEDLPNAFKDLEEILGTGSQSKPTTYRLEAKTGGFVWIETDGRLIYREGKPYAIQGVARDITGSKRAEEVLRESEERYRLLADNVTDIIWVMGLDLEPIYLSPSIERLQGFSVEEALARKIDELLAPAAVELVGKTLVEEFEIEALEEKDLSRSRTLELELKCRDGSTLWSEVNVRFLRDEDGKAVSLLGISRDISERRRAEEEKAALEEQLRHAQKMEAIGSLASGIAHDFNNLLTGILGHADLLKLAARPGDDVFQAADVIEKASNRASELTRQLLGFAQRGKQRNIPVDMHRVIGDVIALLSRTVDRRIDISERCKAEPSVVMGDPSQLQQVIMNLAINASDAMAAGGEIEIETTTVDLDGEHHRAFPELPRGRYNLIAVTDTGIGIPEDVRDHVFEPFFTTKGRSEGTGMGLAMVYGIVKNHAGAIRVQSEVGVGTRFEVYLPVAEGGAVSGEASQTKKPVHGRERILFVDDEDVVRAATAKMLASLGYAVVCVGNGEEAVDYFREHVEDVDLVILDITMPGMDGGDCFRALRKIAPGVQAVLTSGHALDGTAQGLLDEGMLGFVQKPYLTAQLSEAVSRALGK